MKDTLNQQTAWMEIARPQQEACARTGETHAHPSARRRLTMLEPSRCRDRGRWDTEADQALGAAETYYAAEDARKLAGAAERRGADEAAAAAREAAQRSGCRGGC